ncbi:MAG: SDR family oxidoreductase [Rickettsiales bacterium]
MDIDLTNKQAVVCGASKGIGRATAQELASLGANVTLVARNEEALNTALATLDTSKGQQHNVVVADFSDPNALQVKIEAHVKAHGPVHILVNNTGGPPAGPANEASLDQFQNAFNQHLLCNHVLAQAVLPGMKSEKYGRIINVISTSVKVPLKGLGVSNTIRAAVANWAKTISLEVAGFGITVNNVLPGATDTDRLSEIIEGKSKKLGKSTDDIIAMEQSHIPAGRFGKPEELAAAVAFLASPAAAYINGVNLPVDGGRTGSL